jgi:hypothetical protein
MGMGLLDILMVMFMSDNFKWIRYMEKEFILIKMVPNMMENGEMINKMGLVLNPGKMAPNLKELILTAKNMEKVYF